MWRSQLTATGSIMVATTYYSRLFRMLSTDSCAARRPAKINARSSSISSGVALAPRACCSDEPGAWLLVPAVYILSLLPATSVFSMHIELIQIRQPLSSTILMLLLLSGTCLTRHHNNRLWSTHESSSGWWVSVSPETDWYVKKLYWHTMKMFLSLSLTLVNWTTRGTARHCTLFTLYL